MKFYPSKTHDVLNGKTFNPESITCLAMSNPHYPRVSFDPGIKVIEDSGAFQERDMKNRLTSSDALNRQLRHQDQIAKRSGHQFKFEAIVTYDMLIGVDEALIDGKRVKRRGNVESAKEAVSETIKSAEYYARNRKQIGTNIAFSCQGADPYQYAECAERIIKLMEPEDIFAFGGFCILGVHKKLLPQFVKTLQIVLPMLGDNGITRAHLLGICWAPAILAAEFEGLKHHISFSTDSSSFEVNSVMGRVWRDQKWHKTFSKEDKNKNYHPADLTISNIERFVKWLDTL